MANSITKTITRVSQQIQRKHAVSARGASRVRTLPPLHGMGAEAIAKALGGHKSSNGWSARCPAHDDRHPSLSISDQGGKLLWHCHAGCSQDAVLLALQRKGFLEPFNSQAVLPVAKTIHDAEAGARKAETIEKIIQQCAPARGTLVETYLGSRGIFSVPEELLFHHRLRYQTGEHFPAMVVCTKSPLTGALTGGIHRTYLAPDGSGKAQVEKAKMMLGPYMGGVITFGQPTHQQPLLLGEGIETTLSGVQVTGFAGMAALSANNLETLTLPERHRDIIILADRDHSGRGEEAATKAAIRWTKEGRKVRVAIPQGFGDFNDLLLGGAQ